MSAAPALAHESSISASDLLTLLECPVCLTRCEYPLMQCKEGHLTCNTCIPLLDSCPICRSPLDMSRNLILQQLAEKVRVECKYHARGCSTKASLSVLKDHEEHCLFRDDYACPLDILSAWQGPLALMTPHLVVVHQLQDLRCTEVVDQHTNQASAFTRLFTVSAASAPFHQRCVLRAFSRDFLVHFRCNMATGTHHNYIDGILTILGTPDQARRFQYQMSASHGRKRSLWSSEVSSVLCVPRLHGDSFHLSAAHVRQLTRNGASDTIDVLVKITKR
ncbi:E3 ubiquitin-protein ligase SIAH1-like protein [Aphelenchoides avenae]|nr:E3 ubiquitin-protein ligase SIAH1-like protein [Aphelenchus avenae]